MTIRFEDGDGSVIASAQHLATKEYKRLQKNDLAKACIVRSSLNTINPTPRDDEVFIEVNSADKFGGILRSTERVGAGNSRLIVDGFLQYAQDAKPPIEQQFSGIPDSSIVASAIGLVSELSTGTLNTIKSSLSFTFRHTSPAEMLWQVREATGGQLIVNTDKTIDYLSDAGTDKTSSTISPACQTLRGFERIENKGTQEFTHVRMLGAGRRDTQITASAVASGFSSGDREVWARRSNRQIDDASVLGELAQEFIDDADEAATDYRVWVSNDYEPALGDDFTIDYPEENVSNASLTATEVRTERKPNETVHVTRFQDRTLPIESRRDEQRRNVQRYEGQDVSDYRQINLLMSDGFAPNFAG